MGDKKSEIILSRDIANGDCEFGYFIHDNHGQRHRRYSLVDVDSTGLWIKCLDVLLGTVDKVKCRLRGTATNKVHNQWRGSV